MDREADYAVADRHAEILPGVKDDIKSAFTQLVRNCPAHLIAVPAVVKGSVSTMALSEAFRETLGYADTDYLLMQAFQHSNCPYVQQLRVLSAARHTKDHAAEIADILARQEA
jgi:hypothetical protein